MRPACYLPWRWNKFPVDHNAACFLDPGNQRVSGIGFERALSTTSHSIPGGHSRSSFVKKPHLPRSIRLPQRSNFIIFLSDQTDNRHGVRYVAAQGSQQGVSVLVNHIYLLRAQFPNCADIQRPASYRCARGRPERSRRSQHQGQERAQP